MLLGMNSSFEWDLTSQKHNTSRDSRANRYLYNKQRIFLDQAVMIVNRGRDANKAIDSICKHYGYRLQCLLLLTFYRENEWGRVSPVPLGGTVLLAGDFYAITWPLPLVIF